MRLCTLLLLLLYTYTCNIHINESTNKGVNQRSTDVLLLCTTCTLYLHYRACSLHRTDTLFAPQGVWFASNVQFICTTGRVVCIIRTIYLYDRACGLQPTYSLLAPHEVWFASHAQFCCCCCSINCADLRGTAPAPLVPASPTSGHTQGSFRIAAPPPEVHRK